jgi:hypothetical protein
MEYRLTTHLGSGPIGHRLERDRLVVTREKSGQRVDVPFSDIRAINLRQDMPGAWTVRIERGAGKAISIPSRHYVRLGQFEDRGPEYVAFVRRLHEASSAANPQIRFVAGSTSLYWIGWTLVVVAGLLGVMLLGVLAVKAPDTPPWRVVFSLPVVFLVGGAFIRQGRGKVYDPRALPKNLLPPGA